MDYEKLLREHKRLGKKLDRATEKYDRAMEAWSNVGRHIDNYGFERCRYCGAVLQLAKGGDE